jgi:hypothetical protein
MPKRPPHGNEYHAKKFGREFPSFLANVNCLLHPCLHFQPLGVDDVILGALDLVGVPTVAMVGLNSLVPLEEVGDIGEDMVLIVLMSGHLPVGYGIRAFNPDKPPLQMSAHSLQRRVDFFTKYLW